MGEEESYRPGPGGVGSIIELTKEIKGDPDNALLYAQRSECFRIIQQHYHAVRDADKVIDLRPDWYKGYYYKGLAEFGAEHYRAAVESFENGLQHEPDEALLKALQQANRAIFSNRMTNRGRVIKGFFFGCLVGALALAANDFLLPNPIVKNVFLKFILFSAWGYAGTELAKKYITMLENDRDQRLLAPDALFPFTSDTEPSSKRKAKSVSTGTSMDPPTEDKSTVRTRRGRPQDKTS
ncbi:uncharacterized protein LOC121415817 [Lytechinus variegatus]|uniref:uncharacterized protein LOC121415817 n=1 Tax=Lytechinus variegatus TaxID=7654 RepID=UPI001BB0E17A|nr:uncharacterized protein LOC121415817 [Lytechinus variegatus]